MTSEPLLHSPDFFTGDPSPTFRELRQSSPVHWHENGDESFWALLKYEDIRSVSANPERFCSAKGITIPEAGVNAVQDGGLIFTDPPRHRQLRKLISRGFTPRQVTILEPVARSIVSEMLDAVSNVELVDFADAVAAPLPTQMIAELIGAPTEDWPRFREWSDAFVGAADPDVAAGALDAGVHLHSYFSELIADRRREPREDLISQLLAADVDGDALTDEDLYNFCWLLLVAGNETTRNLIALGSKALIEHPDQRQLLIDDPSLIPQAIEEMLRWITPVTHMARTATEDVTLRGQLISAGQTVVMMYGSANRDEDIFGPDAESFDVRRNPNPHLGFGFGEHLCIGAALARLEARVLFEELLIRHPQMEIVGEVTRLRSAMVPGVKRMPVALGCPV